MTSSITLHNPDIFYTNSIDRCFWCHEPCCRIDLCFEAYLHRDCEPTIGEDLKRLAEANQLTDDDRGLERALPINAATLLALAEELVPDAEFMARLKALKERQEALLKEIDEAQP